MIERIRCHSVNCYLVRGKGGSVLVDAGNPKDFSRIYRRIKDANVRLILLTHAHPDHVGAARQLARLLKVPIALHPADARLLLHPQEASLHAHTWLGKLLVFCSRYTLKQSAGSGFSPDLYLEANESLAPYGVDAIVLHLPGHTPGSIGVLTPEGDCLVGDALFHLLRPTPALLYQHREQMEDSVMSLRQKGAKILYPGHGKSFAIDTLHLTHLGDRRG